MIDSFGDYLKVVEEKIVNFESDIKGKSLQEWFDITKKKISISLNDKLLMDFDIVRQSRSLVKNCNRQLELNFTKKKNYVIKNTGSIYEVLQLLHQRKALNPKVINCLAFLCYHGLIVQQNKSKAKILFQKSASMGDKLAQFILLLR